MDELIDKIIKELPVIQKAHIWEPKIEDVAKASYEAGIKTVVDFIEKYLPDPEEYVDPEIWHSFLKEHGMEV